ncbi:MAG: RluA family pseudouridine synthase [Veillonellaceae bacterium]|nr:RluA family pseudouridine synthase [Veillonellaceae bacterium]MDD6922562.1 RluA family pseudouridine synthase [Veillonellaceae bacterium]
MESYTVPFEMDGCTAKTFIKRFTGASDTLWRRIKHSGTFSINGRPAVAALSRLCAGDTITWEIPKRSHIEPADIPIDIVYEDDWLIVVNKIPGMVVHPTSWHQEGTLGNAIEGYYARTGQHWDFHPVHRLDKLTSGLVLIAKAPQAQYQLHKLGRKSFHRQYLAIITGEMEPYNGTIDLPIGRTADSIIERMVRPDGQNAITHYTTEAIGKITLPSGERQQLSLLRLKLDTGRTHQIRVHLAHEWHPIIGDSLYGGDMTFISRQALHAYKLDFTHPMTGESISLKASLPSDMKKITDIAFPNFTI